MLEFIGKSLEMAKGYGNKMRAGMFFIFVQNFSVLLTFSAIYLGFYGWMDLPPLNFG